MDGISDERFGLPTPCSEWTVRGVLNHLVAGNLVVEAMLAGRSHPDRDAWDLATATGQPTDLDPELADHLLAAVTTRLGDRPRHLTPFEDPRPVPDDASAADRLAAYLGRSVAVR